MPSQQCCCCARWIQKPNRRHTSNNCLETYTRSVHYKCGGATNVKVMRGNSLSLGAPSESPETIQFDDLFSAEMLLLLPNDQVVTWLICQQWAKSVPMPNGVDLQHCLAN